MKCTLRIPTKEQFAFVEIALEGPDTPEFADSCFEEYTRLTEANRGHSGLPSKDFDQFLDNYLTGERTHVSDYEKMSDDQKRTIQIIKRSKARINSRLDK